jgi:hypothetical protein
MTVNEVSSMHIRRALFLLGVVALLGPTSASIAESRRPVSIPERFRTADAAVVARISQVKAAYERNQWGDEIIVSHTVLAVEEALKGAPGQSVAFDVEGGTVGEMTLRVSDMPEVKVGDRGVFFLKRGRASAHEPHLRGQGILLLDDSNRVRGTSLTLDQIRSMARGNAQQ